MSWFNYYGLIIIVIIMIPNLICMFCDKSVFENKYVNKSLLILEQIGRYGCMVFITFNIPYTYFGFWFDKALIVYLSVDGALLLLYCLGWIIFGKGKSKLKMLWLSITPALLFLFSGIVVSSLPLIVFSVLFGIGHIIISCKNSN